MGITSAFYIAQRGLAMAQTAMEVVSHNVANVNTEGYSRQRINLITSYPAPSRFGPLGTGVDGENITRMYDKFIVRNLIDKTGLLAKYEAQKLNIDAIETIFNESAGNGINEALSDFWNAWQEVANNPEGNAERMNLLEKGDTLSQAINYARLDLDQIKNDLNRRVEEGVDQINVLVREISDINEKIIASEAGQSVVANDLRDQRDEHIRELSQYLDIQYYEDPANGAVTIQTPKGTPLVDSIDYWELDAVKDELTGDIHVMWLRTNGSQVDITDKIDNGNLGGWIELRDEILQEFNLQFESFTESLIAEVNRQFSQGVGLANYTDLTSDYDISEFASFKTDFSGFDNNIWFEAMSNDADTSKIGIRFVKASSVADSLTVNADYVADTPPTPPDTEAYNITVVLPINAKGQITATAEDVVRAIYDTRTPGLSQPAPFPPAGGPPYAPGVLRAGDLINANLARGDMGNQLVEELINPDALDGFYRLNWDLENVLPFGQEIQWGHEFAQLETDFNGDNNDLVFSVKPDWLNQLPAPIPSLTGEEISVEIVIGAGPAVAVVNNNIQVTMPAGSTANDVITAIQNDPTANNMINVVRADDNSGEGEISAMSRAFLDRSGSFDLIVYDKDGEPTVTSIKVRPDDTKDDVIEQINNITIDGFKPISAGDQVETGKNFIRIQTEPGYEFAFGNDTANALMALGLNTYWSGENTQTIEINQVIKDDIRLIATGRVDEDGYAQTGDNSNALDLADIKDEKFEIRNQTSTISQAYNTLASNVGATAHAITRDHDFNAVLVDQLHAQRDMVSAVNLDEEMSDLLKFQYMYQASAKMISTVDEMLQTLLSVV